jgi:hypothetical protein
MTPYTEVARVRADPAPAPAITGGSRLSIARRPPLELPMAASMGGSASSGGGSAAPPVASGGEAGEAADPALRAHSGDENLSADPDFDLSSAFDVPAFLRRQEG